MSNVNYYMVKIRETWDKYDAGIIDSNLRDQQLRYYVDMIEREDRELAEKLRYQYNLN